ncbi:hypothetical protein HZA55_06110 [Candidatus Poribacteria bacterium]|nr:hypothetical protein [Candidatus Poribacteria bacterium]
MNHTKKISIILFILYIFCNCIINTFAQEEIVKNTEEKENISFTGNKFNAAVIDEIDTTKIWFSSKAGIIIYNRVDKKWEYLKSNVKNVNSINIDPYEKETIWIGTSDGIKKYNRTSGKAENVHAEIIIKTDTTFQNQNKTDSTQVKKSDTTNIKDFHINSIVMDSIDKDNIWFASKQGLLQFNRKNNKWIGFTMNDGLLDDNVNSIAVDKYNPDLIWIGTNKGINVYNRNNKNIEVLPLIENKTDISIYSIMIDGVYVLFGASNGIDIYNKNDKKWKFYSDNMRSEAPRDKIISIEIDKTHPSYVWFGSEKSGIYGFDKLANVWYKFDGQKNMRISSIISDTIEKDLIWATVNVCNGGGIIQYNRSMNTWHITEPLINLYGDFAFSWRQLE